VLHFTDDVLKSPRQLSHLIAIVVGLVRQNFGVEKFGGSLTSANLLGYANDLFFKNMTFS